MSEPIAVPSVEELRKEWIAELRSGKIPQLKGELRARGAARCCLGVAGDIAVKYGKATWIGINLCALETNERTPAVLPEELLPLFGLVSLFSSHDISANNQGALANLNDRGATFAEIADLLEGKITSEALHEKYPNKPSAAEYYEGEEV